MDCVSLTSEPKTDRRVLPQPAALEPAVADKPKGLVRNGRRDQTVGSHGLKAAGNTGRAKARSRGQQARGETSAAVAADASPAQAESGVSRNFKHQNRVFVLGRSGEPLMPCHPARARRLLAAGRARVHRLHPFTIRLTDRTTGTVQPILIKLDPGSKVTGIAIVRQNGDTQHVLHLAELTHRGAAIRKHLTQRAMFRRRRRTANLRYRAPRFNNRTRQKGWLPPSLMSRVDNTLSWIDRFRRFVPVTGFVQELVRFDMQQAMGNPDIQGVEYQQGTLAGYELREYLLEKWGRKCAYCGIENIPIQIEHIHPKARGGSNRVTNLTLACRCCNESKGAQPVEAFLAKKPALLKSILAQAKRPLSDAAAVNATRWELWRRLDATGLPVRTGSGGRTKWNRSRLGIPKSHCLDAVCAGPVGDRVTGWDRQPLAIKATGRGSYQRTRLDSFGFPRGFLMRQKLVQGFQTGDLVRAVVPTGKKTGTHTGRVAVRESGSFDIQALSGTVQGISHRHCRLIMRADGYAYHQQTKEGGVSSRT